MKKPILLILLLFSSGVALQAQFINSEAMSGFEKDVNIIIEHWNPDQNKVIELRFKPSWDNQFFHCRGRKQNSLLLQYVNDTVLKQQDYFSAPEFLVKTADGWANYDNVTGQKSNLYSSVLVKDSARYYIEKYCTCIDNLNCCTITTKKTDSLNRVVESKMKVDSTLFICNISYIQPNKIWEKNVRLVGVDTTDYYEYYYITEPFSGQHTKTDSLIVLHKQNYMVETDTIVTITHYQFNRNGSISQINRIEQYLPEENVRIAKSKCIAIYRNRYPKRHIHE